jgi:ketosteroid isomerase-like protein
MVMIGRGAAADELAIRQLTTAFADAVSRRDRSAFGDLWTPDAVWDLHGLEEALGQSAIVAQFVAVTGEFSRVLQFPQNGLVWVDGDFARARWQVIETGRTADGRGFLVLGLYQDRLAYAGDRWRFTRRQFRFLHRGFADLPGKDYDYPQLDELGA